MNPPNEDIPSDRELEVYLSGDSDVSRRYRAAGTEEPPAELDRAILAQARAVTESTPVNIVRFPGRKAARWAVPFAVAATVLLTFAIVQEAGIDSGFAPHESVEREAPEQSATGTAAPAENVMDMRVAPPPASPQVLPELAIEIPSASESTAEFDLEKSSASALSGSSPPPVSDKAENVPADSSAADLPRAVNAPLKAKPEPGFLSGRLKRSDDDLKKAQAPGGLQDTAAPAVYPSRQEAVTATSSIMPPPAPAESKRELSAEKLREPKVWLEDIRKLRAAGKEVEAETELKLFLEAHPGYFEKNPDVVKP